MASKKDQGFAAAEKLLRQGRVEAAVREFRRLTDDYPRDLLLLNRVGDLLARSGRPGDAVAFYRRLAEAFAGGGFHQRAVAIYKKILRAQPGHLESLVALGDVYRAQELKKEARLQYREAARRYLQAGQAASARRTFEKIAELDPDDLEARMGLAQAKASEGQAEGAAADLASLGWSLAAQGRLDESQKVLELAESLHAGLPATRCAQALLLQRRGERAAATETLEALAGKPAVPCEVPATLAVLHVLAGEAERARAALEPTSESLRAFFSRLLSLGPDPNVQAASWEQVDALLSEQSEEEQEKLLAHLVTLEEDGHIPALERLYGLVSRGDDPRRARRVGEDLAAAYKARGLEQEARAVLAVEAKPAPEPAGAERAEASAAPSEGVPSAAAPEAPAPPQVPESARTLEGVDPARLEPWLRNPEAPAVPLSSADEEFVNGQLTEAEVLAKYGLQNEAVDRLRQASEQFPGHLALQERLLVLAKELGLGRLAGEVLLRLALARRAGGDVEGAREAAREAAARHPLEDHHRAVLEALGLLQSTPEVAASPAASVAATPGSAPAPSPPSTGDEIEIDFEGDAGGTPPPEGAVEEVQALLAQGMREEAAEKLRLLQTLGYEGPAIEALARDVAEAEPSEGPPATETAALDDEALREIAEALETELDSVEDSAGTQEAAVPSGKESLEEALEAFRRQVEHQVEQEDFQTHYDLGIAYKEMGLLEDALREFQVALRSPDHRTEACIMLGLCWREQGDLDEAARWYREALEAGENSPAEGLDVRYELAEILEAKGEAEEALRHYQDLLEADPAFRDVPERLERLRARLGS